MKTILSAFALASLASIAGASIIVSSSSSWMNTTAAGIYTGSPAIFEQVQTTAVNGLHTTASANYNGVHNNTAYDFSLTGSTGHLLVDFTHSAEAVAGQYGEPHNQAVIYFNVTDGPVD